jgi:penicillin G amidase
MKINLGHILATLVLCCLSVIATASQVSGTNLSGLSDPVTVRRDARSVLYIDAANDRDAAFVQGFETARDRLFQMDLLRRVARGETAEIFGRAALEEDKRWRRFGFTRISEQSLRYLSPDLQAALESYARGVNAYIGGLSDENLPVEMRMLQYRPRPWTAADSIVIGAILSDALSTTWRYDLIRASLQKWPKEKLNEITEGVTDFDVVLFGKDKKWPVAQMPRSIEVTETLMAAGSEHEIIRQRSLERIGLYAEELAASNNWVISGKRTFDGKPILANDPHLSPQAPGIWHMVHITTPQVRVAGVTFPGVPGVVLGHNEWIAWGATNVGPDVQDLYLETFNDKGEYRTPSGWAEPTVRREAVKVRTNPAQTSTEEVFVDVVETRHGPIILEEGGKRYALRWTALDPKNSVFGAFHRMNRARNWTDFKNALRTYGGPAQNFIYADVKGNIGWQVASRIPVRRTGDGALPYDGSGTDGDWVGFIPFEEFPSLYNPPSGLIVTANQRIVGTSYKYQQLSRDAAPPWRARRILDELERRKAITMDDVRDVQHDDYNLPLVRLAKALVGSGAVSPATANVLSGWNGRMTPDSRGALLANEIRNCLANRIAEANPPAPASIIRERILDRAVAIRSAQWLPAGVSSYSDLFKACDASVRSSLSDPKRFGPDDTKWTWGRVWMSRFAHPLASVPLIGGQFTVPSVPISGSGQTPNVGSGVSMRHITSPGNWDATRLVIPLGQSGDPRSPFFKDQFEAWRTGTPMLLPFTRAAVEKAAVTTTILSSQ